MKRELPIKILLGSTLIVPSLLLGAVHPEALAIVLLLSTALLATLVSTFKTAVLRFDFVSTLLLVLIAFTLFQMIPLPSQLVKLLSPNAWSIRIDAMDPLKLPPPTLIPLSLDVPLTLMELAKLCTYLSVYWTCVNWTRLRGSNHVLITVVVAGTIFAAVFLSHKILMSDKIYGIYKPLHVSYREGRLSAPLINENHMSALLGLCTATAIGLAVSRHERSKRFLLIGIASLIGGSLLLTLSRGGIAAFIAGQLLFICLILLRRFLDRKRASTQPSHRLSWVPLGLACSLGMGLFAAQDAIIGEFLDGDHKKIEMIMESAAVLKEFPFVGAGRGAFIVAFPTVSEWAATTTFTHAENVLFQLTADYGLIFGLLGILGFVFFVAKQLIIPPKRSKISAVVAALVAVGLHNLVDFNLEIPGVAIIATALLGVIAGSRIPRNGNSPQPLSRFLNRPLPKGLVPILVAVNTALGATTLFWIPTRNLESEETTLKTALTLNNQASFSQNNLQSVINRHPASWYIPFIVGVHHLEQGTDNPMPWLGRAISLNPHSAGAHFHVGKILLAQGYINQAMLEFRIASDGNPKFARYAAALLVNIQPHFSKLSAIAQTDEQKALLWDRLSIAFTQIDNELEAEKADRALLQLNVPPGGAIVRQSKRLAARNQMDAALQLASKLNSVSPNTAGSALLQADIHTLNNDHEQAVHVLEKALSSGDDHPAVLRQLAWAHQRNQNPIGANRAVKQLRAAAQNVIQAAAAVELEGDIARAQGRDHAAISRYRQASVMNVGNERILVKLLALSKKLGDTQSTGDALRRLVNLNPQNSKWQRELNAFETRQLPADFR